MERPLLIRPRPVDGLPLLSAEDAAALGAEGLRAVLEWLKPRAPLPTPIIDLPELANAANVASVVIKNESSRMGLGSFKALGGGFAVAQIVLNRATAAHKRPFTFEELSDAAVRAVAETLTFGCATAGNHGRSVAAAAHAVGAKTAIFVHSGVSEARIDGMRKFGAHIISVDGAYDDAVLEATERCAREGWIVLSDTSWPGYDDIPRLVMQGYGVIAAEAFDALPQPPTHIFVQAGVGGIAGAIAGHAALRFKEDRPVFVVVEPERAACLKESAEAGQAIRIAQGPPTAMTMLECYEPSHQAWRLLTQAADAFMTISEATADEAVQLLAAATPQRPAIASTPSGACGLAGFMSAARDTASRSALRLDKRSRVLLINTEGQPGLP